MNPLANLERLKGMHQQLVALAQVTVGLLENQDLDALDDAWGRRRRLFKELRALHGQLKPLFAQLNDKKCRLPSSDQARCRALAEEIRQMGRKVLELDRRAEALLLDLRQSMTEDFKRLNAGRRLIHAYNPLAGALLGPDRLSTLG